jgi:hypothetical protein
MSEQARFSAQFKLTDKRVQTNNRRAQSALRTKAQQLFNDRIGAGVDIYGKPFKPYTKRYAQAKRRFIKSPGRGATRNRARSMPSFIRRTGRLLSSVKIVVGSVIIGDTLRFDVTFKSDLEYARYIADQGREWLGLSDRSSPRHRKEIKELYDTALRALEFR